MRHEKLTEKQLKGGVMPLDVFKKFYEVVSAQPIVEDVFFIENTSDKEQDVILYGYNKYNLDKNEGSGDGIIIKTANKNVSYRQCFSQSMSSPMIVHEITVKKDGDYQKDVSRIGISCTDARGTTFQETRCFFSNEFTINTSDLESEHFKFIDGNSFYKLYELKPKQKAIVTITNQKMNYWAYMFKEAQSQINQNKNKQ